MRPRLLPQGVEIHGVMANAAGARRSSTAVSFAAGITKTIKRPANQSVSSVLAKEIHDDNVIVRLNC